MSNSAIYLSRMYRLRGHSFSADDLNGPQCTIEATFIVQVGNRGYIYSTGI